MGTIFIEILLVLFLLIANGAFAMSELAILSAKKLRLQQWANQGNVRAQKALSLMNSPERFLSSVQIGITLVGILSGAVGGATLAEHLEDYISQKFPALGGYAEAMSVVVVVTVLTYFSIIIGELVPKQLALRNPEKIAALVAGPMTLVSRIALPFVHLLSSSTQFVLKILGMEKANKEPEVTEEDVSLLVEQGTIAGVFEKSEQAMLKRVLAFGDKKLVSIMTVRRDIMWLDASETLEQHRERMRKSPHSHFPVAIGSLDQLLGAVHTKVLCCLDPIKPVDLGTLVYHPLYIPESRSPLYALEIFKQTGIHIAFIIDEFGGLLGIITLNDILEAIVGDLPSRDFPTAQQVMPRDDGSWLVDGLMAFEEFKEHFHLAKKLQLESGSFQTVAGFALHKFGRIPIPTDNFECGEFRFEVMDMDSNRIDKVLVSKRTKN